MKHLADTLKRPTTHTVTFQPGKVVVTGVPTGETILRAAARVDEFVLAPCAGAGSCGKCVVRVESGEVKAEPTPKISPEDWQRGFRLACVTRVAADVVVWLPAQPEPVSVPGTSMLEAIETDGTAREWELDPPVRAVTLTLASATPDDRRSDLARFRDGLGERLGNEAVRVPLRVVQTLPNVLREGGWTVTAVVHEIGGVWEVARVSAGKTTVGLHLAVLDLGTTTVWGQLVDARDGSVVASSASFNGQVRFGEDVISRMVRAREHGGKERLQTAAVGTINRVLDDLVTEAGLSSGSVEYIVVAGNSAMTCLLLGVETNHLRLEPYVPPLDVLAPVSAVSLGLGPAPADGCVIEVMPLVGSYIGGDVVAGVMASGIADGEDVCLYLDIGTNGEAVIGNKDWLLAASCSAGPAFEGGGLRHGMRATAGAIESLTLDRRTLEPSVLTIDDAAPLGICGSGVIDAVGELLKAGVLLPNGRFDPDAGGARLHEHDGRLQFVLVPAEFSATGTDIVLTEADVENVIRAKAAMFAGVTTLLKAVALEWADLNRIVIAGAFGRHLRVGQGMSIGLFPELDSSRFEFFGNGSLRGCRYAALSREMRRKATRVAAIMNNIELSDNAQFQEEYVAAMFLPHTDLGRFPALESHLITLGKKRG